MDFAPVRILKSACRHHELSADGATRFISGLGYATVGVSLFSIVDAVLSWSQVGEKYKHRGS